VVGNSVLQIPEWFLAGHTGVTSVTLGSSVTEINRYAFNGCSSIAEMVIPNSVTYIADATFNGCSALASLTIGSNVTTIMGSAFSGTGITEVTVPEKVILLGSGVFSNCSSLQTVYFNAINYPGFVETAEPFGNCPLLASFVFGNQVEKIPAYICYGVGSLKSITIGTGVTAIGTGAFWNCSRLLSATIPNSVKTLGYNVFAGCTSMTEVSIGSGITEISNSVFSGSGLTSVTIPQAVTTIGSSAFANCASLQKVYFNARNCSDMLSLNDHFYNCNALTEAVVGDDVRRIPSNLFYTYAGLGIETVTIGSSVREIGAGAFANCTWLETITNKATRPQTIVASVFGGVEKEYCTLYVPADAIPDYSAADVWKEFPIEAMSVSIPSLAADKAPKVFIDPVTGELSVENGELKAVDVEIYDINGHMAGTYSIRPVQNSASTINISHLPKGIYIVKAGNAAAKVVKQ
jgi:hypothetical protein